MEDYKSQKEAFVSDNLGSSISSILSISSTALTSYALYAFLIRRYRTNPLLDFATTILPLLLSITLAASFPLVLNAVLLTVIGLIKYLPHNRLSTQINHEGSHGSAGQHSITKSPGSWLEESDSDEEPSLPPSSTTTAVAAALQRTSSQFRLSTDTAFSTTTTITTTSSSSSRSPLPSPDSTRLSLDVPSSSRPPWRRRHSPTPSTHTHTAIDILGTSQAVSPTVQGRASRSEAVEPDGGRDSKKSPFLSVYRAHMMIMTIHAILAVDFPIFPRWLGKCEDFGTSLMDVGVGSFVFSLGLVSSRSFGRGRTKSGDQVSLISSLSIALKKSAPTLVLGLIRVLMVKGTEYPEHVTEYGVHWNFFFTLGILPIFGTVLAPIREKVMRWSIMALLVSVCHQYSLAGFGLQAWVMSPIRNGIIGMNKEGLVGLPGYVAIYLLGLSTGGHVMRPLNTASDAAGSGSGFSSSNTQRHIEKRRSELCLVLFSYSASWWALLWMTHLFGLEVSRRLANLPYVLWTVGYNTTFLLGYLVLEIGLFGQNPDSDSIIDAVPPLLEAINSNGLAIFLVANLMTGLINLSVQTMFTGTVMSMLILLGYSSMVSAIAWALRRVRLKL